MGKTPRGVVWIVAGVSCVSLAGIGVLAYVFGVAYPPPGPLVAATPVVPNTAFQLSFPAGAQPLRAFLDYDCNMIQGTGSLPVVGRIDVSVGGVMMSSHEVDTGSGVWTGVSSDIGGRITGTGYVLFDLPLAPPQAGAVIGMTGLLRAPTGCVMRVYVAP